MRKADHGGLVYSTDGGRMCPTCRRPVLGCVCATTRASTGSGDGIVRVGRESKGRGGKTVTLVRGLVLDETALATLGKRLRTACGTGGTLKDGVLELQGDHAERVSDWLRKEGWTVKRTGG
ncbi:MAG: translation initiation factor Sui1 [Pseudomonadota bacterium]